MHPTSSVWCVSSVVGRMERRKGSSRKVSVEPRSRRSPRCRPNPSNKNFYYATLNRAAPPFFLPFVSVVSSFAISDQDESF